MKEGWEIKKLVDVCIVERGSSPRPIEKYQTDSIDGVNWIKIGDTKGVDKYIYTTKEKITKEGAEKSRYVKEGDFILSNSMSFGKPFIMKTDGYIHDGWFVLRLHDFIDAEYFFNLLSSPLVNEQFHKLASGSVVKNISGDLVKKVILPIPPLPEQQRIVTILDECFAAIDKAKANAEQNLKNARELFESYLQGVFEKKGDGWEENRLDEVCEISSKLIDPKKSEFQSLIHIGAGNIESQKGTLLDLKTAKEENLISGKFLFDESMVLYSKIRPYLMKVVNCSFKGLCSADIYPLVPFKGKLTKDFLYHILLTKDFTEYAILGSQRAGMPKVNREHLFAYKLYLPPINIQQTIVQQLDALRVETQKLESVYQQKVADLVELKKSILERAFKGEL